MAETKTNMPTVDYWKPVGVMRHCQLCHEFKWIDNNYLCYDCRKKVNIMNESNIDEKVKEFYEFKAFEDPMATAIVPLHRMLFLDDRTKRIEAARKQYAGKYDVTFVHNAKECLRYLCRQEFDIVSLDHDLDGDDFQNPDDVTSGMEVVRYIVKCGGFPPSQIVVPEVWIHSSNLLAANLMINELLKVGIRAYFRRFEYEDEIKFGDCKATHTVVGIKDKWEIGKYDVCPACSKANFLGKDTNTCHECYNREMKQCE